MELKTQQPAAVHVIELGAATKLTLGRAGKYQEKGGFCRYSIDWGNKE